MKLTITDPDQLTVKQLQAALADHVPPSEMPSKKPDLVAFAEFLLSDDDDPPAGVHVPADRSTATTEAITGRPIEDSPDPTSNPLPVDSDTAPIDVWKGTAEAAAMEPYRPHKLPSAATWSLLWQYANDISKAMTLPPALRGRPADIVLTLVAGLDVGVSMTEAFNKIHIIDGRPSQAAELMRGLITDRGHEMRRVEFADEHASPAKQNEWKRHVSAAKHLGSDPRCAVTMIYRRKEWPAGEYTTCTWTLEMAKNAELISAYDNTGRVTASKKDNWRHWPRAMLTARASSEGAKNDFPDVLGGVSYTPDELGADTDEFGAPVYVPSQADTNGDASTGIAESPITDDERVALQERLDALNDELRAEVRDVWKRQMFPPLAQMKVGYLARVHAVIEAREKRMPEDATVIDCEAEEESSEPTAVDDTVDNAPVTPAAPTVCPGCGVALDDPAVDHAPDCA